MFDWWRRWRERRERVLWEEVMPRPGPPPLPAGLAPPVRELVEIGMAGRFLTTSGRDERTRQIGQTLYDQGGHAAMLNAYEQVAALLPYRRRELEVAWDRIGDWQG